jgi:hypothetical protein
MHVCLAFLPQKHAKLRAELSVSQVEYIIVSQFASNGNLFHLRLNVGSFEEGIEAAVICRAPGRSQ